MSEAIAKPRVSSVTLKIDESYRERLKSLAVQKNRSAHYLMKEAIDRYLKAEEAQQAVLTSVDEAIAHYEVTGLHLSHADVKAWAQELKTNPRATLPNVTHKVFADSAWRLGEAAAVKAFIEPHAGAMQQFGQQQVNPVIAPSKAAASGTVRTAGMRLGRVGCSHRQATAISRPEPRGTEFSRALSTWLWVDADTLRCEANMVKNYSTLVAPNSREWRA